MRGVAERQKLSQQLNAEQVDLLKPLILHWAASFSYATVLDSHHQRPACGYGQYELLAAAGLARKVAIKPGDAFGSVREYTALHREWLFGYWGYDLKNEIEKLSSSHVDKLGFPDALFYVPEHVVYITRQNELVIESEEPAKVMRAIVRTEVTRSFQPGYLAGLRPRMRRNVYVDRVNAIRQHIEEGDVYELNFCQEFYAEGARIVPLQTYEQLTAISPAPYAAFMQAGPLNLICASPERFLMKHGNELVSQPIKGTMRRGMTIAEDAELKHRLRHSEKEQAENLMIVDLVRNDLSRSCLPGTVGVKELFGIYSFSQVHQMISTIKGQLKPGFSGIDAIKNAFPMGSMTGAPKIRVMQLIEQYELSQRGLYSGALGYIAPNGDFDFNVVIRSILYNKENKYLSYQAGSAITYDSDAETEYEECLLKAAAIRQVLGEGIPMQ